MSDAEPQVSLESAKQMSQLLITEGKTISVTVGAIEKKAVEAWQAGQGEEALKMMAGEVCPYTQEDLKGVLLENLSSGERDQTTGQKKEPTQGPEKSRYDETTEIALKMQEYLEKGGEEPPKELVESVVDYISHSSLFRDLIYDANGKLKQSEAESIAIALLHQQGTRQIIHRLFTERLDPTKRLKHEEVVETLKKELKALEGQVILESEEYIRGKILDLQKEIRDREESLREKPMYARYLSLKSELKSLEEAIRMIEEGRVIINSPDWSKIVALLPHGSSLNNKDRNAVLSELISLRINKESELATDTGFDDIKALEEQISALREEILIWDEKRRRSSSPENIKLREAYFQKQQQLAEAQALLTGERIKYSSEIIAIPKDAVKEFLDKALAGAAKAYKEEAQKQAAETAEKAKDTQARAVQKIADALSTRDKKGIRVPDRETAKKYIKYIFEPGGISKFMQEVIGNDRTRLITSYGLSNEEADLILAKKDDPKFIEEVGANLAGSVIADYLRDGGRFSKDELEALGRSEWGRNLINQAMQLADTRRKFLEDKLGKGVLKWLDEYRLNHKSVDWLMKNWWVPGGIIALLLIFFGPKLLKGGLPF